MRLGALLGPIDADNPNAIIEQSKLLEAEGYSSLWSAQAIGRGNMMTDPFVALTLAAAVTESVELGTAILQLPLYHPTDVALKVFSLMQASGNRLLLGIGAGSTESDHQVHDSDFSKRFLNFNQSLTRLRAALADGESGHGNLSPWPGVTGGPPLLYGTWGKGVARAASEFDGWIGSGMHRSPDELETAIVEYRNAGGRRAIVSTILMTPDRDLGEVESLLKRFEVAGFDDAVVMFLPGGASPAEVRKLLA